MRKEKGSNRYDELIKGATRIFFRRGFSEVTIADLAKELRCSASSLYKIAPSKDSLVVVAIARWGDESLEDMERRSARGRNASERATIYYREAVEAIKPLSHKFREDVNRYDSARMTYDTITLRFVSRFVELLDEAVNNGEIRPVNTHFLALVLRQAAFIIRDEDQLEECGMTAPEAMVEIERLLWDGVRIDRKQNPRRK